MLVYDDAAVVLDGIQLLPPTSLTAQPGSLTAVRGPNGAGKSTLLSLAAAVRRPTTGSVTWNGIAPDDRSATFRAAVGGSVGPAVSARDLTVREHLTLIGITWRLLDVDASVNETLDAWDLSALRDRYPHELSSGQRQLFTLALAWIRPAQLLLLDEPEQRLDGDRRARLVARIAERISTGVTALVATHSDEVAAAAEQVVWLDS